MTEHAVELPHGARRSEVFVPQILNFIGVFRGKLVPGLWCIPGSMGRGEVFLLSWLCLRSEFALPGASKKPRLSAGVL
jgi:hypothetical protein